MGCGWLLAGIRREHGPEEISGASVLFWSLQGTRGFDSCRKVPSLTEDSQGHYVLGRRASGISE